MTKNNAFGAIRLIAALMVIFSHSYPVALGGTVNDPLYPYMPFSIGTVGVYLFFAISGILVTKSFVESKSAVHFAVYRILRIYPGVIVCLLFTTFVIGPIYTASPLEQYFSNAGIYQHVAHNGMLATDVYSSLPRVFESNPSPFAINNSIWTLVWELRAYLILLVAGYLFAVKRSWLGSAAILAFSILLHFTFSAEGRQSLFLIAFFLGGLLYQLKIDRPFLALGVATALAAACYGTKLFELAFVTWSAFFVYSIGTIKTDAFIVLERFDLSYGLYLYGWPLGQAIVATFGVTSPVKLFVATTVVAGIAAFISWHFIERPALLKKRLIANNLTSRAKQFRLSFLPRKSPSNIDNV